MSKQVKNSYAPDLAMLEAKDSVVMLDLWFGRDGLGWTGAATNHREATLSR